MVRRWEKMPPRDSPPLNRPFDIYLAFLVVNAAFPPPKELNLCLKTLLVFDRVSRWVLPPTCIPDVISRSPFLLIDFLTAPPVNSVFKF